MLFRHLACEENYANDVIVQTVPSFGSSLKLMVIGINNGWSNPAELSNGNNPFSPTSGVYPVWTRFGGQVLFQNRTVRLQSSLVSRLLSRNVVSWEMGLWIIMVKSNKICLFNRSMSGTILLSFEPKYWVLWSFLVLGFTTLRDAQIAESNKL